MSYLRNFLIVLLLVYLIKKLLYVIRGSRGRKPDDVEFFIGTVTAKYSGLHTVCIAAPFYDEPRHFEWRLGLRGLNLGFTPIGLVARVVSETFKNKYLLQAVYSDLPFGEQSQLYDMGLRAFKNGIQYNSGVLIYSPQVLSAGALQHGIGTGADFLFICPELTEAQLKILPEVVDKIKLSDFETGFKYAREILNVEGIIFKRHEGWYISSQDDRLLDEFVNNIFDAAYERLFDLKQRQRPSSVKFPNLSDLWQRPSWDSEKFYECKLYFDNNQLVTFISCRKKYEVRVTSLPKTQYPAISKTILGKLKRYLLPQIVPDRAYTRLTILRFSLQYFLLAAYGVLFCFGMMNLAEYLFGEAPGLIKILALIIGIPVPSFSIIISLAFLFEAIFSRRRMIRTGF
jgi:hypothetical protein